jgi:hypothetical protein
MIEKVSKSAIEYFVGEMSKDENKNRLKHQVIDPIFMYIIDKVYPYVIISSVIFILIFLISVLILFMVIRK